MRKCFKKVVPILLFLGSLSTSAFSQSCASILGQNPSSAIPVCGTTAFHQDGAASCDAGPNPIASTSSCTSYYSHNSFWYKFHCYQTGTLGFIINGTIPEADYDWEVFDITGRNPADVLTDASMAVSLNLYGVDSPTPPFPNYPTGCTSTGVGNVHCEGETNPFNEMPTIIVGHDYLLMVTNFFSTGTGYFLDLTGGTAVITDPVVPGLLKATGSCDNRQVTVKLNKKMKCKTLAADGSDFRINYAGTSITSAVSVACSLGFDTDSLILTLSNPLPGGAYRIFAKNGTDANTMLDYCDAPIPIDDSVDLNIEDVAVPGFNFSGLFCSNKDITFTDISTPLSDIVNWHWDMGDGNIFDLNNNNPFTHQYTSSGTKTVTLTVTTNRSCIHTISRTVNINLSPLPSFTNTQACLPNGLVNFNNTSTIADASPMTFSWDFGDPASGANNISTSFNPSHFYAAPGPYTVTLTATSNNSCVTTTSQIVNNVFAQPISGFTYTTEACVNNNATFHSTSDALPGNTVSSYQWDFGDATTGAGANPFHIYTTPGTYTVKHWIVNSNGCNSDTTSHDINIIAKPTAVFSAAGPFCEKMNVTITDASVPNAGAIINWNWDFGDASGSTQIAQPPPFTHSYLTAGVKTVILKVTTDKGCEDILSKNIVINPSPVPSFIASNTCLPYATTFFTNTTSIADGTPMSYSWDFGDPTSGINNTSTATNPSHFFVGAGPAYSVTLIATGTTNGCINSGLQPVSNFFPQAHSLFTVLPENCLGTVTSFTSNADGSGSPIASYHWDFGDATTGTGATASHVYATAGLKTIKHWIVTSIGCNSDTTTHTVYINQLPSADFASTPPTCQTRLSSFTDASVPNDGTVTAWQWDFGDIGSPVNTSILPNPQHIFSAAGVYNVSLIVTTDKGCNNNVPIIKPVTIHARPHADFVPPEVCLNDTYAQFNDNSTIATGTINSWLWDFGDPGSGPLNASALPNPQHSYSAVGPYNVQLIVTSDNFCTDTLLQPIFVNGSFPVADVSLANTGNICVNDLVTITNHSTVFPGTITKVEINWDDVGTPGIFELDNVPTPGKNYTHLYPSFQSPATKNFIIRFRAYSGGVCMDDKLLPVTINASPKVQFNAMPDTCLLAAPFLLTQASEPNSIPGNGVYSGVGITNPNGTFDPGIAGVGVHTIKYKFTSLVGCMDSLSRDIRVLDTASARFLYSAPPACDGSPVTFTDLSVYPIGVVLANTIWDFGDLSPLENHLPGTSFTHTFPAAGTYTVKMYNTSAYGCNSTLTSQQVLVSPVPQTLFEFGETSVCIPSAKVSFINKSTIADGSENAFTYYWDFGDPASGALNTSTAKTPPPHLYSGVGPYTVSLTVTSGVRCPKTYTDIVDFIHPQPKAKFVTDKPGVCLAESLTFTDVTDPLDGTAASWHWDMGDGDKPLTAIVNHTYLAAGTFTVSFYMINSHNCNSDTAFKSFTVYPYPVVNAGPDRRVLEGSFVRMQPVVSGNDLQYLWTPDLYLNNNRILACMAQYVKNDITYKLTVTGRGGCPTSDDVFIKVLKNPKIPNTFTPNNDGINDKWAIQYLEDYANCFVQVFTRTGQKVFESRGTYKAWDGKFNGKPVPFDTYYYIIEAGDGQDPFTGYVTVLK
jgi:gliding motility-associated-like protein